MTGRRTRYRLDTGQLGLSVPGMPYARLVILCEPCSRRGLTRTLATVEMDTGEGADAALWIMPRRPPGNLPEAGYGSAVPVVRGTGEAARAKLICGAKAGRGGKNGGGCQNTPDISLKWITGQLSEIAASGSREPRYFCC